MPVGVRLTRPAAPRSLARHGRCRLPRCLRQFVPSLRALAGTIRLATNRAGTDATRRKLGMILASRSALGTLARDAVDIGEGVVNVQRDRQLTIWSAHLRTSALTDH